MRTRPATAVDMSEWFGFPVPMTVRAHVLEGDDGILGLAGWYRNGAHLVVFSEVKLGLPKMTMWRCAKAFMATVPRGAICVTEGSGPFLERLGWVRQGDGEYAWLS